MRSFSDGHISADRFSKSTSNDPDKNVYILKFNLEIYA